MSAAVRIEKSGPVTTVILDRPEARNSIGPAAAAALHAAFLAFERDPEADAAVLWGAGGAFCAGADLKHLAAAPLRDALRQELAGGLEALRREGVAGAARFAAGEGRHGTPGES